VAEAQQLLEALGFDRERTNERSALVLLSLLGLTPDAPLEKSYQSASWDQGNHGLDT